MTSHQNLAIAFCALLAKLAFAQDASSINGLNYLPTETPGTSAYINGYYTGCNYFGPPSLATNIVTTDVYSNGFFGTVPLKATTDHQQAYSNGFYGPDVTYDSVSLNGLFSQYTPATMTINAPSASANGYDFFVRARANAQQNGEEDRRQREYDPGCESSSDEGVISDSACPYAPYPLRISSSDYPCLTHYTSDESDCVPVPRCVSSSETEICEYTSSTTEDIPCSFSSDSESSSDRRFYRPNKIVPQTRAKKPVAVKKPTAAAKKPARKLAVGRRNLSESSEVVWPAAFGFVPNQSSDFDINYRAEPRPQARLRQRRLYQVSEDESAFNDSAFDEFSEDYTTERSSHVPLKKASNPFDSIKLAAFNKRMDTKEQEKNNYYRGCPRKCSSSSSSTYCPVVANANRRPCPPHPLYRACSSSSESSSSESSSSCHVEESSSSSTCVEPISFSSSSSSCKPKPKPRRHHHRYICRRHRQKSLFVRCPAPKPVFSCSSSSSSDSCSSSSSTESCSSSSSSESCPSSSQDSSCRPNNWACVQSVSSCKESSSESECSDSSSSSSCSSSSSESSSSCSDSSSSSDSCRCKPHHSYVVTTATKYYPTKFYYTSCGTIYTISTSYATLYTTGVCVPMHHQPACPVIVQNPCGGQNWNNIVVTTIGGGNQGSCAGSATTTVVTLSTASKTVTVVSTVSSTNSNSAVTSEPKYQLLWTAVLGLAMIFLL